MIPDTSQTASADASASSPAVGDENTFVTVWSIPAKTFGRTFGSIAGPIVCFQSVCWCAAPRMPRPKRVHATAAMNVWNATALAYVPLFSLCSKRELRQIAKCAKTKEVRAGTTLMAEGEQGDTMYVLLSGHAAVQKGGRRIAQVERGGVLGELAVLAKTPRNATVTTTTDAEIAVIGRRDVFKLIEDAPGFSRKLLEALAERVRELDKKIVC